MQQKSFLRRFRVLLAISTICIAATTYWGIFQYNEAVLKLRTKQRVSDFLAESNMTFLRPESFSRIMKENNKVRFAIRLKSQKELPKTTGKLSLPEIFTGIFFQDWKKYPLVWEGKNNDLCAVIVVNESKEVLLLGVMTD